MDDRETPEEPAYRHIDVPDDATDEQIDEAVAKVYSDPEERRRVAEEVREWRDLFAGRTVAEVVALCTPAEEVLAELRQLDEDFDRTAPCGG